MHPLSYFINILYHIVLPCVYLITPRNTLNLFSCTKLLLKIISFSVIININITNKIPRFSIEKSDKKKMSNEIVTKKLSLYQLFSAINDDVDFPPHCHEHYEIAITLEDGFMHTINGKTSRAVKGEIVILRPGDIHSAEPIEGLSHRIRDIYIPSPLFSEVFDELCSPYCSELLAGSKNEPVIFHISPEEAENLDKRLQYPLFLNSLPDKQHYSPYNTIIKKAIICEIIGFYCHEKLLNEKIMPECVAKLINALQDNEFFNLPISEMAYRLGYSHNYLCAQFRKHFGKTIQKFIIERKAEKAARLLTDTNISVEAIGKSLGWTKTSCFISNFKEIYTLSPLQYRKTHKNYKQ